MQSLILGAGGFIGLNLLDVLRSQGLEPRCAHRQRSNTIPLRRRRARRVVADLDDYDSLVSAMSGVDVVFHAAGFYPRDSLSPARAIRRGVSQLATTLDAAARAGVQRLVYISSTATVRPRDDGRPASEADTWARQPDIGAYHATKWAMEQMALGEQRLEVIVACPGACLGPWDLRMGTSALLLSAARGQVPPHPDGVVNLVDVRDVGRVVCRLAGARTPPPRVLIAARSMRLQALLEKVSRRYGAPPPAPPVDPDAAVAFANAEERRVAGTAERPAIAREIVDLVNHGAPLDTRLAAEVLGQPWTPTSETLDDFDHWARRMRLLPQPIHSRAYP